MNYLPLKHWQPTANWVDRVLPWPKVPSGITDQLAWEIYYRQKADAAASRLALAQMALEALFEDRRLYGDCGMTDDDYALLASVLQRISEPSRGPEQGAGLGQGATTEPASIPEQSEKGVYP